MSLTDKWWWILLGSFGAVVAFSYTVDPICCGRQYGKDGDDDDFKRVWAVCESGYLVSAECSPDTHVVLHGRLSEIHPSEFKIDGVPSERRRLWCKDLTDMRKDHSATDTYVCLTIGGPLLSAKAECLEGPPSLIRRIVEYPMRTRISSSEISTTCEQF